MGAFGVHKFLLGYRSVGAVMLGTTILFSIIWSVLETMSFHFLDSPIWLYTEFYWLSIGPMGVVGFIEGVIYFGMSNREFKETYVDNTKEWF